MNSYRKNSRYSILAWLTASLFYAYHNVIVSALNIASDDLIASLNITTTQFGLIPSLTIVGYAAMQIPVGIMLDHFSLRKLMGFSLALFTSGCVLLSITDSYLFILITRFLMGASAAFAVLGAFRIASEWFDENYFATLAGLTVSLGYLGGILGNKPVVLLSASYSIQSIFSLLGVFGFILTLISFIYIDNFSPIAAKRINLGQIASEIKSVGANAKSLGQIFYAMLIFTPLLVFKDALGVLFFKSYYNYDLETAADIMQIILFASILTAPVLGIISDRLGKRRPIIVATPFLLFVCLALILVRFDTIIPGNQIWLTALLFALFGSITWGFLLSYTVFKETHKPELVSTGLGLMQTVNMAGGIIAVPAITGFIDMLSSHYPDIALEQQYFYAFMILPIFVLLAIPLLKHIPETNCKQHYD